MVAVLGLAVGFVCALLAAYGARTRLGRGRGEGDGAVAENAAAVLLAAIAGPAYLVTRLALHDRVLPVWLGYVAGVATGVLILAGVLQPGLATWPALIWLMVSGVALALRVSPPSRPNRPRPMSRPSQRTPTWQLPPPTDPLIGPRTRSDPWVLRAAPPVR